MIGERLGQWIIEAELAPDELGHTFRAIGPDSTMALLRWFTHPRTKTPEFLDPFPAHVNLFRKLRHPNIVRILEGGLHAGNAYLVQEWIEFSNLESQLRRGERPAWTEVLTIALQIVPALRHAHRRGVLHRDLKPAHLIKATDGHHLLADFGLSKFLGDALLANPEQPLGSTAFYPPEVAAGKPHSKRSDFYSLGCLLYTLIVGRPPFSGNTIVELTHKHCYLLAERPIHFVSDMPEELDRLIMKLMAKEPGQRPGSGTALIQEFEGIWSALERRGLLPKRPVPASLSEESDEPAEDEDWPEPKLPEPIPRLAKPWLSRWYVVVPPLLGCVFLLFWAFFWRGLGGDEMMARARPLMESENPADWDAAWRDYLEPLSRKYPSKYADEVKEARRRIDQQGELRRALIVGKNVRYRSEAERFYNEGVRLAQAGASLSARLVWQNVIQVYDTSEADKPWVALAREGIERLNSRSDTGSLATRAAPVIDEIHALREKGRVQEADRRARALEFLYRDDPEIETLRNILKDAKK